MIFDTCRHCLHVIVEIRPTLPDLVRKLTALGANVRVVLTDSAAEFVSSLSLQAVSGNPVHRQLLDPAAEAAG